MPARFRLVDHLSPEGLFARYQAAKEPVERTHFQVLHLVSQRWRSEDIAEAVGYNVTWIRLLVGRYDHGAVPRPWETSGATIAGRHACWTHRRRPPSKRR